MLEELLLLGTHRCKIMSLRAHWKWDRGFGCWAACQSRPQTLPALWKEQGLSGGLVSTWASIPHIAHPLCYPTCPLPFWLWTQSCLTWFLFACLGFSCLLCCLESALRKLQQLAITAGQKCMMKNVICVCMCFFMIRSLEFCPRFVLQLCHGVFKHFSTHNDFSLTKGDLMQELWAGMCPHITTRQSIQTKHP